MDPGAKSLFQLVQDHRTGNIAAGLELRRRVDALVHRRWQGERRDIIVQGVLIRLWRMPALPRDEEHAWRLVRCVIRTVTIDFIRHLSKRGPGPLSEEVA